jgi:hypothetical protein
MFIRKKMKGRLNSGDAYHLSVQNLQSFRLLPEKLKNKIHEIAALYVRTTWSLRETGLCGVDWIDLNQDRNRWRTFVYTAMKVLGSS